MPTKTMTIRPAVEADFELLRALFAADRPPVLLEQQYAARAASYAKAWPDRRDLVVEIDGEAIGRILLGLGTGDWHVLDIAVLPEHRNLGAGTAIMRHVIEDATEAGTPLTLRVDHGNPATRLYERLGFTVAAEEDIQNVMKREVRP